MHSVAGHVTIFLCFYRSGANIGIIENSTTPCVSNADSEPLTMTPALQAEGTHANSDNDVSPLRPMSSPTQILVLKGDDDSEPRGASQWDRITFPLIFTGSTYFFRRGSPLSENFQHREHREHVW